MNRTYVWRGGSERVRRQGEKLAVQVLILPALFDEANRMRRFTVQLMHSLADAGIGTLLPDLPGTGESETEIARVSSHHWIEAIRAVAELLPSGPRRTVAIRGGALLDYYARGHASDKVLHAAWRLSPESGKRILRDLHRTRLAGSREAGGYAIGPDLHAFLDTAEPRDLGARTMRLSSDPLPAYVRIDAAPLWRRAEPGEDPDMVARVADDIIAWARPCAV